MTASQHHLPDPLQLLPFDSFSQNTRSDADESSVSGLPQRVSSPQRRQATSPTKLGQRPLSLDSSATNLPPLDVQVLQRKRVFLSATGAAVIGVEEIVRLHERTSPPKPRASPLQLTAIPKKCTLDDEVALMPCHSLQYRYVPSLSAECWREPTRDRNKNWSSDELNVLLAVHRASDRAKCAMTNPLRHRKGKWRRWEAMKLHVHGGTTAAAAHDAASPRQEQVLPQQILIRNQGVMISSTYCVVSVLGTGVYGRLYSPGLAERHGASRFLRVEAYDPRTSQKYELVVTMRDLEWVFRSRQQLLVAGKKHTIVKELIALLFFRYPSNDEERQGEEDATNRDSRDADEPRRPHEQRQQQPLLTPTAGEEELRQPSETLPKLPVLCISPDEKLSDAARRRREREERLRLEEEERLRALALLLKLPRRARHRLLCQSVCVSGHKLIVSLYHYPAQVRSFAIIAYHPPSSRTFALTVGVMEAASLSRVFTLPHRWSAEQKLLVAQTLVPMLRFNGVRTTSPASTGSDYSAYRLSLAIREDRAGAPYEWLELPRVRTPDELRDELQRKYQVDGQRALKAAFDEKVQALDAERSARAAEVEALADAAESRKAELRARDAELRELIEEINSGKGSSDAGEGKSTHELRRNYKAERQQVKDDLKTLSEQVAAWSRELAAARATHAQERERAAKALSRATRDLASEALINTRGLYNTDDRMSMATSHRVRGQRTWLARPHISTRMALVASGACAIAGRRCRCSVFRVSELPLAADARATSASLVLLHVLLYDPESSSTWSLELAQLDWISYTKQHHDAQLLVPQFEIATSPVTERLEALRAALTATREALAKTYAPTTAVKKKKTKKVATTNKKVAKLRAQLCSEMTCHYGERRTLDGAAPWHRMIAALGERISFPAANAVALDRCIFHAMLPIVSLAGEAEGNDASDAVNCDVRALQQRHKITFYVVDLTTRREFSLVYPESEELVKEFAVETFMEQQMHLEAVAMTLLFFVNEHTGELGMRFED